MRDRLVESVNHLHRHDGVEIFLGPIVIARGLDARIGPLRRGIAPDLAPGLDQHLDERGKMGGRRGAIDQKRLGRAANAGPPHLGVEHDPLRHVEIGGPVHVDMADAFEMGEDRKPRLGLHAADEVLAAARHDHVDRARQGRRA